MSRDDDQPMLAYETVTDGVLVRVVPEFLDEESDPSRERYVWAYTVDIHNGSDTAWQVMTRHWHIVDAAGRTQAVDGEGVVGQQPMLPPGEGFSYTSGVPLSAASGMMSGSYDLVAPDGTRMTVPIPAFSLDSPFSRAQPS